MFNRVRLILVMGVACSVGFSSVSLASDALHNSALYTSTLSENGLTQVERASVSTFMANKPCSLPFGSANNENGFLIGALDAKTLQGCFSNEGAIEQQLDEVENALTVES